MFNENKKLFWMEVKKERRGVIVSVSVTIKGEDGVQVVKRR